MLTLSRHLERSSDCAKLNLAPLHDWAANGNIFNASHSYAVRARVAELVLFAAIIEAQYAYIALWEAPSASW